MSRHPKVVPLERVKIPEFGFLYNLRETLSWDAVLALLISIALAVTGAMAAAGDVHGDDPWGNALWVGPAIAAGYTTLSLCWRATDFFNFQWLFRLYAVSGIAAILNTIATLITVLFVPIEYAKHGFNYWMSGPFWLIPLGAGLLAGVGASVIVFVAIVLPFVSVARTRIAIRGNLLSENPAFLARNRRAMIGLSALLILVFLVPSLIVVGQEVGNQLAVWIGIALSPVLVFLTFYVSYTQRPALITEFLGVEKWQLEPDAQPRRRR